VYGLAIDPVTPSIVYAGSLGRGVFKSTDGGVNWTLVKNYNASTVRAAAINWPDSYVGTQMQGVFIHQLGNLYLPLVLR